MANEAKIKLSAEGVEQVVNAFRKVQQEAERAGKRGADGIGVLNKSLSGLKTIVAAVGIGALVLHLKEKAKAAIAAADAVGDLAQITGAATETISLFAFAAREHGTDIAVLQKGVFNLAQQLDLLKGKDRTTVEVFRRIGLSAKDFQGLSFDQSLEKVALRLGELEGSEATVSVATTLLGKKNIDLMDVFAQLADEGIDKVRDRAIKLGVIFSKDMTDAAGRAIQALGIMQAKSQAAAAQFLFGLSPAISDVIDALDRANGEKGESGFKKFGEVAGSAVKAVAGAFIFLGRVIARELAVIDARFEAVSEIWKKRQFFDFEALIESRRQVLEKIEGIRAAADEDITNAIAKLDGSGSGTGNKGVARDKRNTASARNLSDITKEEKARADFLKAQLDNELKLFHAASALRTDAEKRDFENGLSSLEQYFAQRLAATKAENQKEIDILERKRAIVAATPEREAGDAGKKAKDLAELDAQITERRIEGQRKLADSIQEERAAVRDLARERLQFDNQLLTLQGERAAAARAAFAEEVKQKDLLLRRQGIPDAERAHIIGQFETQGNRAIDFDEQQEKAQAAVRELDLALAAIRRDVETGVLAQIQGEQQSVALQEQKLPLLQAEADKLLLIGQASKDATKIEQAQQFKEAVNDIGVAANKAGRDLAEIRAAVDNGVVSEGANFLNDIATNAKTASQAINDFGKSVIATFTSIISKKLSEKLFGSLFGSLGGFGGGLFGLGGATIQKAAEGGKIVGPGTGTSDSILAAGPGGLLRVANGEFIVREAVVRQPGAEAFLHDFNRGIRLQSLIASGRIPRFAGGGLVHAGSTQGMSSAAGGPSPVQFVISPDMAHLTMRDLVDSYLAREYASR